MIKQGTRKVIEQREGSGKAVGKRWGKEAMGKKQRQISLIGQQSIRKHQKGRNRWRIRGQQSGRGQ